jgi:NADH:ubiquinone reductase (H+-translocating)
MTAPHRPTVIIIGAGFGGLNAAQKLAGADVDVLMIDRHNFHLFTPLLYQVATSGLDPSEIAYPVRSIFRDAGNFRFLMGTVEAVDTTRQTVTVRTEHRTTEERYDYLIVAAGSQPHYFGQDAVREHAFDLKTLWDAVTLRNHILRCFEQAAWIDDPAERAALTTMVVVGGGPTGLETAGALHELVRHVLRREYRGGLPDTPGRVVLVEMQDHLLDPYPPRLQRAAFRQLESLGVEVILGRGVVEAGPDHIRLADGTTIATHTLVWAAGVRSATLADRLGVPLRAGGRVPVLPTLQVEGLPGVYAVGDIAYLEDPRGTPYPMLIPVAKQQGMLAARNILRRLKGEPERSFKYIDRGIMATIGRSRAVAWIFYRVQLTGFVAWLAWLGLHLITLLGFRNRLNVFINWVWNYLTYDRSVRIILQPDARRAPSDQGTIEALDGVETAEAAEEDETLPVPLL